MPNWCENTLVVSGDKKTIKQFKQKAKGTDDEKGKNDLSLGNFIPMPKELEDTTSPSEPDTKKSKELIKKYGAKNWYDWKIQNWGVKWDVKAELVSEEDGYLEYVFDSPWSPPLEWLETVAKLYKTLFFRLKYEEEGMGFLGVAKAEKGKMDDQSIDY